MTPEEQALIDQQREAEDTGGTLANAAQGALPGTVGDLAGDVADFATGGLPALMVNAYDRFPDADSIPDPAASVDITGPSLGVEVLSGLEQNRPGHDFSSLDGPKGGPGKNIGSVAMDVHRPVPQEYVDAQEAIGEQQAMLRSAYQTERARALGIMVDMGTEFEHGLKTNFEKTDAQINSLLDEAELEAQGIDELVERAESNQINPGQFFANVGDAGKFASALAVGAGAMATAFGGGPNVAHDLITRAIDRNVRSQMANQTHNRALIAHQANFVNTIRGLANDRAQYGNYVRLGLIAMTKAKMAVEVNRLGQTGARLAARDVYLQFHADLVAARIKAITNSAARVTVKFKTMGQMDKILAAQGYATQQAPIAAGRKGGGGKASGTGSGQGGPRGTAAIDEILTQLSTSETAKAEAGGEGMTPDQLAKRAALLLQHHSRGKVSTKDAEALRERFLNSSDLKMQEAGRNLRVQDFKPADFTVPFGLGKNAGFHIISPEVWEKAQKDGGRGKLARAVQAVDRVVVLKRLLDDGGNIAPDIALLRDTLIGVDGNATISTFFSKDQAKRRAQIDQVVNTLIKAWHLENADGARNALNLEWEKRFAAGGAGVDISVYEWLADWFSDDTSIRVARLGSSEEDRIRALRTTASELGLSADLGL